jgi:hypothetical protein
MDSQSPPAQLRRDFARSGRLWLRGALAGAELQTLRELSGLGGRPGARVEAQMPLFKAIAEAAFSRKIRRIWPGMRPVRVVDFDKSSHSNWSVPWHQDRIIAVKARHQVAGFDNWSCKHGTWHCEPPEALLHGMLFTRIHLDASTEHNGAMEIAPGSHREGRVSGDGAEATAARYPTEPTLAQPGDVLILNMLTLHRSRPATTDTGRHTLRVDYAPGPLPAPLDWAN